MGAEAGGILGVSTPTFLALHPHFLESLKMELREGGGNKKIWGWKNEKNFGG